VTKHNQIKGLATAAGLWAAAGVGLALGVGFYEAAIVAGFAIYAILTLMQYLDRKMHRRARYLELYIEITWELGIGTLIRSLRGMNVEIEDVQLEGGSASEEGSRGLIVTMKAKKRGEHMTILEKIRRLEGVAYIEEL
jgi:putative Mg2+ transporter-C (MgtC) family protein